jgi:hypothetical protein
MINIQIYPKGLIITNRSLWHETKFIVLKTMVLNYMARGTSREACHDAFIHHPPPTPAPSQAGSLQATHQQRHYLEQQIIARLNILILSKTYPSVITTSPTLDMRGFWPLGFLLLKSNKEYVLTFKVLAQVLIDYSFLNWQSIASISCAIQLIKHKYS